MAFFKLKIESGFKTVSSYNYKFGAFPLLGGGLGWGLIYYKVRFYESKIENCFKTVSSHTYHNAVITRNVSDEVIQLNDNYRLPRKFSEIFAKL